MNISTTISTMLRRGTVLSVLAVSGLVASAQTFVYEGVIYKAGTGNNKTVLSVQKAGTKTTVGEAGPKEYVGDINVPGTLTYDGTQYTVSSVGSSFKGCVNLTSLTIGEGVTTINRGAFQGDSALVSISIPTTITATKTGDTFKGCKSLKSLTLHGKFKGIQSGDLAGCVALEKIVLLEGDTPIDFDVAGAFTDNKLPNLKEVEIYRQVKTDGKTVTDKTFRGKQALQKVTIGGTFTDIPASYFENCPALSEVVILNEPTSIGTNAFASTALTEFTMPASVAEVSTSLFQNCKALKTVILPEGVTTISPMAFYGAGIETVNFPTTLKSIGDYAFVRTALKGDVVLNDGLTRIGQDAFELNAAMTSITIPASVTTIGDGAFNRCSALAKFVIGEGSAFTAGPDGAYILADEGKKFLAFAPASAMTEVVVPVEAVAPKAMWNASKVTKVDFGAGCKSWGNYAVAGTSITELTLRGLCGTNIAAGCPNLTTFTLDGMTEVPGAVVKDCPAFTTANVGEKITIVRKEAFANTPALQSLNLGSILSILEADAFKGSGLKEITVGAANPAAMSEGVFTDESGYTVKVPVDLVDVYKNAAGWRLLNIVGDANIAAGPTDMGMPAGLYYAGTDGNLYAAYADGQSDMYDVGGAPHTFQLIEFKDRIYGASAGKKFVYSGSAGIEGDGKLFYISKVGGAVFQATVLDNAGNNAYKDPFGLYIYGDTLYVNDRNVCVRKIAADAISLPQDYPSWMENNWMGFYDMEWSYGCIKSGWAITKSQDANGNPEPEYWVGMKYNGNGIYRFKEEHVGKNSKGPRPENGSFLTGLVPIFTTFFIDEAHGHIYIYIEKAGNESDLVKGGVYRINLADLEATPNPKSFSMLNPVLVDGAPVKYEGTSTNEHVGISQFSPDAKGEYLYWCYRAPTAAEAEENEAQDYATASKGKYWWAEKYDSSNPLHQSGIKRIKLGEAAPKVEMIVPGVEGYGCVPVNFEGSVKPEAVEEIIADAAGIQVKVSGDAITVDADAYVRVYDMSGLIVAQRYVAAGETMSVADLTAGGYIVAATLANGSTAVAKFVK